MSTVVKFGGSLLGSPERDGLLAEAARAGAIVVPGGGPFADAVRAAQPRLGFGAGAAHAMAILAMEQTARALADLHPALAPCGDAAAFAAARARGRGAIWLPAAMALAAPLPASWDVTSDSLSLWLAATLGADRLVLLKSDGAEGGPQDWAKAELVDPYFPRLAEAFAGEIALVGPATRAALAVALASPVRRAA
ncbi:MAG: aspartate kinase [Ancylobacter novellus]|uniref:Aspartate kinase n=1 Tax=Ancylobacter novellus TaxID=921 RepID=A0A2W5ME06_ANCNO|nr:MAG: aspartate kinase [Ancylobacter novellus]